MESVSTAAGTASPSTTEVLKDAIVVDTQQVKSHLDEVVRSTVEQTLIRHPRRRTLEHPQPLLPFIVSARICCCQHVAELQQRLRTSDPKVL